MQSRYAGNKPKFLEQLVKSQKLSSDGRDWLTLALDPFHDYEHPVAGYPDADGSQTIVSCYTYQLDVAKPAAVVGNWDCHVFNTPEMTSTNQSMVTQNANWLTMVETALSSNVGPLTVLTGGSGVALSMGAATTTSAALPALGTTSLISGITRVIGMGFEVTNTTSALHKQGAVTSYRMPQYLDNANQVELTNAAGTQAGTILCRRSKMPPLTVAEANLLKGTRTWDAAEGVYAVCVQNSQHNPMMLADNVSTSLVRNAINGTAETVPVSFYTWGAANVAPVPTSIKPSLTQLAPFDTTGSFFTGLSEETTLTIKLRVYLERAPGYTEPDLAVLATPSAGLDEYAMTLYSHAIAQLPVAVTVKENGIGDWFRGVVSVLRDVSATAGNFLNPIFPGAANVGNAVTKVLTAVTDAIPGMKDKGKTAARITSAVQKATSDDTAKKVVAAAARMKRRKAVNNL